MNSAAQPKTQIRGPFPGFQKPKRKQGPSNPVDIATLSIVDDELPASRTAFEGYKYDSIFERLKPGQAVKCATEDVSRISGALRHYLERKNISGHMVRSVRAYEGSNTGRVWLLKADKAENATQKGGAK